MITNRTGPYRCSTAGPIANNTYAFMRKWNAPAWTTIGVRNRHHSPFAIARGAAPRRAVKPGTKSWARKTAPVRTRIALVAGAVAARTVRTLGADFRASATHSGQCCPTDAGIAHRPQI